jgi:hypothetical protein
MVFSVMKWPCHNGMTLRQFAKEKRVSIKEGSCENIE